MTILTPSSFIDYELLDSGDAKRFERFGVYTIVRPDPQAIWKPALEESKWQNADALFERATGENGIWKKKPDFPASWLLTYKNLSFYARLTPFKHTGVFPEQSAQWDFITTALEKTKQPTKVLNLFGYTGIATLAAAAAGAQVTHVDASKASIAWAKENQQASKLANKPIRWILDDALKFTAREIKRGVRYDGIIMDPPIYGHGPEGERWKFQEDYPKLLDLCQQVLSAHPLFVIINAYAISASALMLKNTLEDRMNDVPGTITYGELALKESQRNRLLSTGIFARWSQEEFIQT